MKRLIFIFIPFFLIFSVSEISAQKLDKKHLFTGTTYGSGKVNRIYIPPPEDYYKRLGRKGGATIDFIYTGFNATAIKAVEYAGSILETILPDNVHITVLATLKNITTSGVLANSSATGFALGWGIDAFQPYALYPSALAEKIAGVSLNSDTEGDIELNINSSIYWYYGIDGNTPTLRYDLVTVVLHELIHGLGFYDSFYADASTGSYGASSIPLIYDKFVESSTGKKLTDTLLFANPSVALKTQITSRALYFKGPVVSKYLSGGRARLYAPSTYDSGSSVAHLDDETYSGADGLMTPFIDKGEAVHNTGGLVKAMLGEIGWINTSIIHTPQKDTEEHVTSITVNAEVKSDTSYNHSKVGLVWSFDNFENSSMIYMSPAAGNNKYTGTIPVPFYNKRLDYFISTEDYFQRIFMMPSDTSVPNSVFIGTDTIKPKILHAPADYYFSVIDTLKFEAQIEDNLGIDTAYIEYRINLGTLKYIGLSLKEDNDYTAALKAKPLAITGGDSIGYRIIAFDKSAAGNQKILPSTGYFYVKFETINAIRDSYETDFSSSSEDFLTNGFKVIKPVGFTSYGLHTRHPYESPEESGDSIGYVAILRTPVRFDDNGMIVSYSEVVLVEPGETGSEFGSDYFYDYVVVEGSRDFGKSWFALADGYDSRYIDSWESAYNSAITDNNSTYIGTKALLARHILFPKVSQNIASGDTMMVRFRLFSDPYANGWGWCIEDLHIGPLIDNIQDISVSGTTLYPNPGSGMIHLRQSDPYSVKPLKYSIASSSGSLLSSGYTSGYPESVIDISSYPAGIYFIILQSDNGTRTLRYTLIK
jgi:hypothetical protein